MSERRAVAGVLRWLCHAPAERMTLPGAVLVLAAAEALHAGQVPPVDVATGTLAVAAVAALGVKNRRHGRQAAAAVAAAGGWVALATSTGPFTGPDHPVALLWASMSLAGYIALRNHQAVRSRREWRKAKHAWNEWRAASYGIGGSKLLDFQKTRLGEALEVDVRDTGHLASHLATGGLAEQIAGQEMLPASRVQVRPGRIAGRVRISIRHIDPWATPPLHPVLDPAPEIQLSVPCTIRYPVCVGLDPETGSELRVTLWDKHGAKNILIVGMQGAGKSVLLSNIRERITAAEDAVVWDVNLSKALEDLEWARACDLSAVTEAERGQAAQILRLARGVIQYRAAQPRHTANFVPSPGDPLVVLMIDEIDAMVDVQDGLTWQIKDDLKYIASKSRSEGVVLIIAGQRATAEWIGGANVRSQIDTVCVGMVARAGEVRHAVGEIGVTLPDMATYGEGAKGVWLVTDHTGSYTAGRTFDLEEPDEIRRLAAERAAMQPALPAGLAEYLGASYQALKARQVSAAWPLPQAAGAAASGGATPQPPVSSGASVAVLDNPAGDPLERLDFDVPDDLRGPLGDLDAKIANARKVQDEIGQINLPDMPADKIADRARQGWAEIAAASPVPADKRDQLHALLSGDGCSIRSASEALGESVWTVRRWLENLRAAGLVLIAGEGRARRWRLTVQPPGESPES